ncbi:hypothetical protein ACWYXN_05485 [Janthinobacterium aestuarii]|nr:hypothetical protein [Janthinobacterium lividum]
MMIVFLLNQALEAVFCCAAAAGMRLAIQVITISRFDFTQG